MKDYVSDGMRAWSKNFRVNSKTTTTNNTVKELYDIILKEEMTDSDYWYFGGGADEFIQYLSHFDEKDIQDLMMDVANWTEDQIWILRVCLTYGCMDYANHRKTMTFEYQSLLLTFLFSVTEDDEIKNDIFENAAIIDDGKPKPYDLLIKIKIWADTQISNYRNGVRNSYNPNQVHYDLIEAALQKAIR